MALNEEGCFSFGFNYMYACVFNEYTDDGDDDGLTISRYSGRFPSFFFMTLLICMFQATPLIIERWKP